MKKKAIGAFVASDPTLSLDFVVAYISARIDKRLPKRSEVILFIIDTYFRAKGVPIPLPSAVLLVIDSYSEYNGESLLLVSDRKLDSILDTYGYYRVFGSTSSQCRHCDSKLEVSKPSSTLIFDSNGAKQHYGHSLR
jgi:hypothetical protein